MGQDEAVIKDKDEAVEPPVDDDVVVVVDPEETPEGDGATEQEAENVIVREGETPPQDKEVPAGVLKRINRLNGKVREAKSETSEVQARADKLADENAVYKAHFERLQIPPEAAVNVLPNPENFPDGSYDQGYQDALRVYNEGLVQTKIDKGLAEATQTIQQRRTQQDQAENLEKAQIAHCKRSADLGVKDFEAMEEIAISILGNDMANQLIQVVDRTDLLFYYFGKNKHVAEKYADMLKTKPGKALAEIGGLLSEIKVKPKSEIPPDPDVELEGGAPSNEEHLQNRLNKLREAARSGSSEAMGKVLAFKKEHEGKGLK